MMNMVDLRVSQLKVILTIAKVTMHTALDLKQSLIKQAMQHSRMPTTFP